MNDAPFRKFQKVRITTAGQAVPVGTIVTLTSVVFTETNRGSDDWCLYSAPTGWIQPTDCQAVSE